MPFQQSCELFENTACKNILDHAENITGMSALTYNTFIITA